MQTYFLVEFTPKKNGNVFEPTLLVHSPDFELMMLALHHHGHPPPQHATAEQMLALYSVESPFFKPSTMADIGVSGSPRPGSGITPLAVCIGGQSIFFDEDFELNFLVLIDRFQNLPTADCCSPVDRAIWQARLGLEPPGTDQQLSGTATLCAAARPDTDAQPEKQPAAPTAIASEADEYFSAPLRYWITALLATDAAQADEQVIAALTGVGINVDIATALVEAERKACLLSDGKHRINFELYEPDDDRVFSATDMYAFAYQIAQEFMIAAFKGSKLVDGVSLEFYIESCLEIHEGDGSHSTWLPKSEWPHLKAAPATVEKNIPTTRISPEKKQGGGRSI